MGKYKLDVEPRVKVPVCRERYCEQPEHWVKVTVYVNDKIVYQEKELKTFKAEVA